jgi:hypothetical protein
MRALDLFCCAGGAPGRVGRRTRDEGHREGGHQRAASEAMGIDWATLGEMSEAIPPVYAQFIAEAWLKGRGLLRGVASRAQDAKGFLNRSGII